MPHHSLHSTVLGLDRVWRASQPSVFGGASPQHPPPPLASLPILLLLGLLSPPLFPATTPFPAS